MVIRNNANDVEDIKALMAKYCHGIDKRNEVIFMSVWDKDGVYDLPNGRGEGTEGINQLVHKVWEKDPRCHHHVKNPRIEIDANSASAVVDVIFYRQMDDGLWQMIFGIYTFEFIKKSGVWYIKFLKFSQFSSFTNNTPISKDVIKV